MIDNPTGGAPPSEPAPTVPPGFRAPWSADTEDVARALVAGAALTPQAEARIDALARDLIDAIRAPSRFGGVEDLLHEYALSTAEGVALMMLAEALLRVPDDATADRLIADKLAGADFAAHEARSDALIVSASVWGLATAARIVRPEQTPQGVLAGLSQRLGAPTLRIAARRAMRIIGGHFVIGETIEAALSEAFSRRGRPYRYSFDMLGEGARAKADAERYFDAYAQAVRAVGAAAGSGGGRCGISVKLSALHPRFEAVSRARVLRELTPRLIDLARLARGADLALTVDAEEADRLELTLDVFATVAREPALSDWDGLGLAVQAYQFRAGDVIDWLGELARATGRRIPTRLVKGAYWDAEIKRAQERGLDRFPVFTRKPLTDLSYMACAERLLALRPHLAPQFATHNALTVAAVLERAGDPAGFEFQRLHGMGEDLYERLLERRPEVAVRVYAPVGTHRDLLAYLVRRLLENGANSSFVARVADPATPIGALLTRPQDALRAQGLHHPGVRAPQDVFAPDRINSRGVEFGHAASLAALIRERDTGADEAFASGPIVAGAANLEGGAPRRSPIDGAVIGHARDASADEAARAMDAAAAFAGTWDATPAAARAEILERAADLLEARRGRFIALLQTEGGKTLDDSLSEVREAADFCRYYATQARKLFAAPLALPGPTGEDNLLRRRGRGPFVCISPWNFPLAIFMGQVCAALAAGDTVVAKPAEQTPLVAFAAVRLLHEAGVPDNALHLAPGDGAIGEALVAHPATAGVAFTGSTEVARRINQTLAAKDGPIVPLIAETGGINAMIVDASALAEQATDDIVISAFRSAGQRCSALRLLCVQEDIADDLLAMMVGAARELAIGDPRDPATHIGPVIDADAKAALDAYLAEMRAAGRLVHEGAAPQGLYVAPAVVRLDRAGELRREVFGPVLHMARWSARADGAYASLEETLREIEAVGYGLTIGVQSRIAETARRVAAGVRAGNVYVNRSMIGAVVGSQPFGGAGLSGTGPKAGGPDYLPRFSREQTVTTNSAAAGGNADLLVQ